MLTSHLSIRVGEYLDFDLKTESSVKDHMISCNICANNKYNVNLFKIIKKYTSNFKTKIHEALLIKHITLDLIDNYLRMDHCFVKYIFNFFSVIWIFRGVLLLRLLYFVCIFKLIIKQFLL